MKVADVAECYAKHADALVRFAATQVGPDHADDVVSAWQALLQASLFPSVPGGAPTSTEPS